MKNYQNIRKIHAILENGTFILQYFKLQKQPAQSETPQYHLKQQQFGLWNWKTSKDFEMN